FFSSRSRHTSFSRDWSSDVCSSDLTERLLAIAEQVKGAAKDDSAKLAWRGTAEHPAPVEARLSHALVHGITDFITADTEECWQQIGRASCRDRVTMTACDAPTVKRV